MKKVAELEVKVVKVTLASKLDEIAKTGGTWVEMLEKANEASKKLKFTTKFNAGVLRAHVNYRIKTQNKVEFLGTLKVTEVGIQ